MPELDFHFAFPFRAQPFSLMPDPAFLFWTSRHGAAFTVLQYGLFSRAPITVLTGEIGTGKTTLVQHLLREVSPETRIGLLSNAQTGRGELLDWILDAFGVESPSGDDHVRRFNAFRNFVVDTYGEGGRVMLIVDEAQNLGSAQLEELRMLTNINSGEGVLLQLLLVGQPELLQLLRRPDLRQFAQRVSVTYHLGHMSETETLEYVRHRLTHVGGSGDEFTEDALHLVHETSGGVPRIVNKLCDLALVYASAAREKRVTRFRLEEVLRDGLQLDLGDPPPETDPVRAAAEVHDLPRSAVR
ncbi:ExeA family protein [Roseivivax marinus]|uniref:ExeA family protein n=1 Tax=Roseivivax marinus TaxID=1379903 RepID=UPI00273F5DD6|nr:AAA family ATPase [Roseivivax marinus]